MKKLVLICAALIVSGCAAFQGRGTIRSGDATVIGVKDAGKPATLNTGETRSGVAIPAGTPVTITRHAATPATPETPFQPAREEVTFTPSKETRMESVTTTVDANTGTVDTTVALKKVQVAARAPLLYAAFAAAALAAFFVYIQYPTPAMLAGGAAVIFFLAWKLSELPEWVWALGLVSAVAGVVMWRAHERGLKTIEVGKPIETVLPASPSK